MKTCQYTGKCSTFGGPQDRGVSRTEGLALVEPEDLAHWWFRHLFLDEDPKNPVGLADRLNPDAYYFAMRFDYNETPRTVLRNAVAFISANDKCVVARAVDWGPHVDTGRIVDVSPGVASALGVKTDDVVSVRLVLP